MANRRLVRGLAVVGCVLALSAGSVGCHLTAPQVAGPPPATPINPMGKELSKVLLPDHVIEPPDILMIDAQYVVPKPPYRVAPLDVLQIQVANAFPTEPIAGLYPVEPDGAVNLGPSYGRV